MNSLWESYQSNTKSNEVSESDDENVNCIEMVQRKIEENDKILREIERFKRYVQNDYYIQYDEIESLFHKIGIPFDLEEKSNHIHNRIKFQTIAESDIHIYTEDELWVLQVLSL
jgi:hypothetical protein